MIELFDHKATETIRSGAACFRSGLLLWIVMVLGATFLGCGFGPRSVVQTRLAYNEAVKTTSEEQFLLNIVRLRYINTPSSLAISNIADQQELASELQAIPFFVPGAIDGFRAAALPQATLTRADRKSVV